MTRRAETHPGRGAARALLAFAAVLAAGLLAWPVLERPFCGAFTTLESALLAPLRFGRGGHAEFMSGTRAASGGAEDAASWNTRVALRLDGSPDVVPILINPRRLAYLPLLVFVAALAAAPLRAARRLVCLLCGLPALAALALASVWLTIASIFARVPQVYALGVARRGALELASEALVNSLASRLLAPLLLALLLVSWQSARATRDPREGDASSTPDRGRSSDKLDRAGSPARRGRPAGLR